MNCEQRESWTGWVALHVHDAKTKSDCEPEPLHKPFIPAFGMTIRIGFDPSHICGSPFFRNIVPLGVYGQEYLHLRPQWRRDRAADRILLRVRKAPSAAPKPPLFFLTLHPATASVPRLSRLLKPSKNDHFTMSPRCFFVTGPTRRLTSQKTCTVQTTRTRKCLRLGCSF